MRYVCITFLALAALLCAATARAAESELLVVPQGGMLTIENQNLLVSGIRVESGALLVIRGNSVITLKKNANIEIFGALRVTAGDGSKVVFAPEAEDQSWGELITHSGSTMLLDGAELRRSQGPFSIGGGITVKNTKIFHPRNGVFVLDGEGIPPEVYFENISFHGQMGRTLDMGIIVKVAMHRITITQTFFHDLRRTSSRFLGVKTAVSANTEFGVHHERCSVRREGSGFTGMTISFLPCEDRELPVLFVPGLGGSVNLSRLSLPISKRAMAGDNWVTETPFTPSYTAFMRGLTNYNVPYMSVGYDWRLPPDVIAEEYLVPAIAKLKQRYGTRLIRIVAHSYGGIVTQAYVKGSGYAQDVASVMLLGTPSGGTVAALGALKYGTLPKDMGMLRALLRWWAYQDGRSSDTATIISQNVPSLWYMLPSGVEAGYNGFQKPLIDTSWPRGVDVYLGYGDDRQTPSALDENGVVREHASGDGLVLPSSVLVAGGITEKISGGHGMLPSAYLPSFISKYFPLRIPRMPIDAAARNAADTLKWIFDCEISVSIEDPEGNGYAPLPHLTGGGITWIETPIIDGEYKLSITSESQTPQEVRWWVNDGDIAVITMQPGEEVSIPYDVDAGQFIESSPEPDLTKASPSPSQSAIIVAKATPMPSQKPSAAPVKSVVPARTVKPAERVELAKLPDLQEETSAFREIAAMRRLREGLSVERVFLIPTLYTHNSEAQRHQVERIYARSTVSFQRLATIALLSLTVCALVVVLRKIFYTPCHHESRLPP